MKFIDLFAGLGGFHLALTGLGHSCVFASELNEDLSALYELNHGIRPAGDIRKVLLKNIPAHDILCAGFPCQPFSKAGEQRGLKCPQWGDLIDYVIRILKYHKPRHFIVENVPNLVRHNNGKTWASIEGRLQAAGYDISDGELSPHMFGIPQIRPRAFIVGTRSDIGLGQFEWPEPGEYELAIASILDDNPPDATPLPEAFIDYLTVWQEFLDLYPKDEELPSFPIWAMEFGATYPIDGPSPRSFAFAGLERFRGAFGQPLRGLNPIEIEHALPPYAREDVATFPEWKREFLRKNRAVYAKHSTWLGPWLAKVRQFAPSFQKLEWNAKGGERNIWNYVIQFRASGIRVKRPTKAPSLVAMTTSQVPVIAWERRYMTPRECSRLQSMGALKHLPRQRSAAYKALGNAVNAEVVRAIARALIGEEVPQVARRLRSGRRAKLTSDQFARAS